MDSSAIVELMVEDFGTDPSVVTEILGIQPTNAYSRGQPCEGEANPSDYERLAQAAEEWEQRYVGKPLPIAQGLNLLDSMEAMVRWSEQNQPRAVHRRSQWRLRSPIPTRNSPMEMLDALLSTVEPRAAALRQCMVRFPIHIRCGILFSDDQAQFVLSEELIARTAKLGLRIEFDVYFNAGATEDGS